MSDAITRGHHSDADDGGAFNGSVGQGLADALEAAVMRLSGVTRVCDLGCGNGHFASRLSGHGKSVVALDGSQPYIDIARRAHAGKGITFEQTLIDAGTGQRLREAHGLFDLVVSSEVIEHMFEPQHLCETAFSILRPGGYVVITTPYHGYLKNVAISVLDQWDLHHSVHWRGGHIKFFSVASLSAMMREAGFNTPRFEYSGRFAGFWKNMIAIATRN